ncbi:hypothetical protein BC830DRAFT_1222229 [Chytriomyces sp. MP71]|nr:hypothetical protein BC830DRAFT_1222229 [Chytriomyces sp. MP71]
MWLVTCFGTQFRVWFINAALKVFCVPWGPVSVQTYRPADLEKLAASQQGTESLFRSCERGVGGEGKAGGKRGNASRQSIAPFSNAPRSRSPKGQRKEGRRQSSTRSGMEGASTSSTATLRKLPAHGGGIVSSSALVKVPRLENEWRRLTIKMILFWGGQRSKAWTGAPPHGTLMGVIRGGDDG